MTIDSAEITSISHGVDIRTCPMDQLPLPGNVEASVWLNAARYVELIAMPGTLVQVFIPGIDTEGRALFEAIRQAEASDALLRVAMAMITYREGSFIDDEFSVHVERRAWRSAAVMVLRDHYPFYDRLKHPQIISTIVDILIDQNQRPNQVSLRGVTRSQLEQIVGNVVTRSAEVPILELPLADDVHTLMTLNKLKAGFIKGIAFQLRSQNVASRVPGLDLAQLSILLETLKDYDLPTGNSSAYNNMDAYERRAIVAQVDEFCIVALRGIYYSVSPHRPQWMPRVPSIFRFRKRKGN